MIGALMKYGGVAAKVKTMYGRRLRKEDFERLCGMKTVHDAVQFLNENPSWGTVLEADVTQSLKAAVADDFTRIYKFMSREDHPLLGGMLERAEQTEILTFLRMWNAGTHRDYRCGLSDFFKSKINIDFDALSAITSFEQFWTVISKSFYYHALFNLPHEFGHTPDYTIAKTVMDTHYYSGIFKIIEKKYTNDASVTVGEGFGSEVDLLNIVTIIRIKSYFPAMSDAVADYLIPLKHRLKKPLLDAMLNASDSATVLELAKASPYRKLFSGADFEIIDDYLQQHLYQFNRKALQAPRPSVYTPIAYLTLKEIEMSDIIKIIECIRYGENPCEAGIYIAGLD